jgi:hypothetical protein
MNDFAAIFPRFFHHPRGGYLMLDTRIEQNLTTIVLSPHDHRGYRAAIELLAAKAAALRTGTKVAVVPARCDAATADQVGSGSRRP